MTDRSDNLGESKDLAKIDKGESPVMIVSDGSVPAQSDASVEKAEECPLGEPTPVTEIPNEDTDERMSGGYASVNGKTVNGNRTLWIVIAVMAFMCIAVAVCSAILTAHFMRRGAEPPGVDGSRDYDSISAVVAARKPSVVEVFCAGSRASGVVMKLENGKIYIVTNYHAVSGYGTIGVRFYGEDGQVSAELVGYDAYYDIAVLTVSDYTPVYNVYELEGSQYFDPNAEINEGELVVAIGNGMGMGVACYDGIVARKSELLEYGDKHVPVMRVTAAINAGMSGGALFDMSGNLIGLNTYRMSNSADSSGAGHNTDVEDTGFVTPVNILYPVYKQILATGEGGEIATAAMMRHFETRDSAIGGITFSFGGYGGFTAVFKSGKLTVTSLDYGTPPKGIEEGDVIVTVGGKTVTGEICEATGLFLYYSTQGSGAELTLGIDRSGDVKNVAIAGYKKID